VSESPDSFNCRRTLEAGGHTYTYYSLVEAEKNGLAGVSRLPFSMKVLLENLLRNEDGRSVTRESIEAVAAWLTDRGSAGVEIAYRPARVLMQDFTGVPARSTWPRCATPWRRSAAIRKRSIRWCRSTSSSTIP
jgi:aconitate hydratase